MRLALAYLALALVVVVTFTVTATWTFLLATGMSRYYPLPGAWWQWWDYALHNPPGATSAPWVKLCGLAGVLLALVPAFAGAGFLRLVRRSRPQALYGETAWAQRDELTRGGFDLERKR